MRSRFHLKRAIEAETFKLFVLGCLLLSFALRLYRLGSFELWGDEAASYSIATLPTVMDILAYSSTRLYEHPPLYYILLHFWIKWAGKTEWLLRFPSVFFGVLSVSCAWLLFKKLGNGKAALLTVILLTLFPPFVALSQEVRMYTLFITLSLIANWALLIFSERKRVLGIAIYFSVTILGFFTHYFFLWLLIAHLLWGIYAKYKGYPVDFKLTAAVLFFLLLSAILTFPSLVGTLSRELRSPALDTPIKERIYIAALELTLIGEPKLLPKFLPLWAIIAACGLWILALYGGFIYLKSSRSAQSFCLFWLTIPVACIIFSYGLVRGRYLSFTIPAFVFFISQGFDELIKKRALIGLSLGILLSLDLTYGLNALYTIPKGAFGQAARFILDNDYPGDAVILSFPMADFLANYYLASENLTIYRLPEKLSFIPREWEFLSDEQVDVKLKEIFSKHPRLWLGPYTPAALDPEAKIERWLNSNAFPVQKVWFPQSTFVALYLSPWFAPREESSQLSTLDATLDGKFQVFLPLVTRTSEQPQPEKLISIPVGKAFEDLLILEEVSMDSPPFEAGQGMRLELKWRVLKRPETEILVSLSLKDLKGTVMAKRLGSIQGALHPYILWVPGDRIEDHHGILIPQAIIPGTYELWLGLYSPYQDRYITVQGQSEIKLAQIQINPGHLTHPVIEFGIRLPEITLIGTDRWPEEVLQGQPLPLTFYWMAHSEKKLSLKVFLCESRGKILTQSETILDPAGAGINLPIRTSLTLMIPGRAKPGRYIIRGEINNGQTGESFRWLVGKIKIQPITRSFRRPFVTSQFEAEIKGVAKLLGYEMNISQAKPGETLYLTLFWQAIGEPETNYTVFTHLVGPDGKIWGQKDNPPAKGSRPTTTWVKGEYITDEYVIPIHPDAPEGFYTLYTGFYNPQTLERLPAFSAEGERFPNDSISIATIQLTRK